MTRQLTQAAQVAKLCKQYLKSRGIACRVRSENYSMGNSVNVYVTDQPPEVIAELKSEFAKYKYGYFDGMTDCYEYSNSRDDIPQTKFLFIENGYSAERKQAAYKYLRATISGYEAFPAEYSEARSDRRKDSDYDVGTEVYQLLNGSGLCSPEFYDSLKAVPARLIPGTALNTLSM